MDKDITITRVTQSDFTTEIRRRCRTAVDRYGGIRAFSKTVNENESLWQNRLTDGRVVGFDVSWLLKVFSVTGDYRLIVPFFKQGKRISISAIAEICKRLNHIVLPVFNCSENDGDSTYIHLDNLLQVAGKLIRERGK